MTQLLWQALCAALGTLSFAVLFHVQPRFYGRCAITGGVGWLVYLLAMQQGADPVLATFAASLPLAVLARVFSVKGKAPVTVFLICGIFPLVPGAGIYYAAYYFVQGHRSLFGLKIVEVIKVALALALGIAAVLSVPLPGHRVYGPRGEDRAPRR